MPSREIISLLARQWGSTSEEEKQIWRYRAEQSRNEPFPTVPGIIPDVHEMEDELEEEAVDHDDDEHGSVKRRALKAAPIEI